MSLISEQHEFLQDVADLIKQAAALGFVVTAGELWRSHEQQEIYVKTGRSRTMKSNHIRRLAVDLNFFKDGRLTYDLTVLKPLGDYWESLHPLNRWGGNFKSIVDVPHFERNVP